MDIDTFLTTLYVWIDDWYSENWAAELARKRGAKGRLRDSEVLTLGILGQWRVGVAWQSERGMVGWMQAHGRGWFPQMLGKSQFNERMRHLWGVFVELQAVLAALLEDERDIFECVDCTGLPICSLAQAASHKRHWLSGELGQGGNQGGWYYGNQVLVSVTRAGVITGWLLAPAHLDDRWLLEAFLSTRAGVPSLAGPARPPKKRAALHHVPHWDCFSPRLSVGRSRHRYYLADRGFNGARWLQHWHSAYEIHLITAPARHAPDAWSPAQLRWLAHHRQIIETVFARLTSVFGIKRLKAHTRWGQLTRFAAITAAHNWAIWLNRSLGRPDGALETLLC